jgi:twitching motility protein PilT
MSTSVDPSVRFADVIHSARIRKASDVHIAGGIPVVFRIDGALESVETTFDRAEVDTLLTGLCSESSSNAFERCGDVTISISLGDGARMRAHLFRSNADPVIAIRLLDRRPPSLEALDMPPVVRSFLSRSHGLIVMAGPTGCGKSTTLAAMVAHINSAVAKRIVTIEDPIEYRHRNERSFVSQREIGVDATTLEAALIGALRADPDVLVVGEARDATSMRPMLMAAETGHLVLATLHTGTAAETADRIVDAFDSSFQAQARTTLAETLIGIVCQRLVRRPVTGRRAVVEVLVATPAVKSLIRQSKTHMLTNAIATGRRYGMQTFAQHAEELVFSGEISPEEAQAFNPPAINAA